MMASRTILIAASAFLVLVLVIGGGVDLAGYLRTPRPFPSGQWTRAGVLRGESQEAAEAWLREESTIAKVVRPAYHEILHKIGRNASPAVVVGRDMLFDAPRLRPYDAPFWARMRSDLVEVAAEVQRGLAPWGGRVLIAMVPDTIRIYPDQVPGLDFAASPKAPYYGDVVHALEARGVGVLDLVSAFAEAGRVEAKRVYREDDHHWNHVGCRAAALSAADWMRRHGFDSGADLKLTLTTSFRPADGSLLRASGWDPGSPLARHFRSDAFLFEVRRPSGTPYVEPWVADVVVASDSFGDSGFAGLLAMTANHRVADVCVNGRGPFYPLFAVLNAINEGWRPRLLIWLFEERASYSGEAPFKGWVTADMLPDPRKGIREHRIPGASVRAEKGATAAVQGEHVAVLNESKEFELRLPRPPKAASHVVLYARPPFLPVRETTVALVDADAAPMEARTPATRALVLDAVSDTWERIILPVPAGSSDLLMRFDRAEIGGEFLFQGFGWIAAGEPPPEPRLPSGPPRPSGTQVLAWAHQFVDDRSAGIEEMELPTLNPSRYGAQVACTVSTRFTFQLPPGESSAVPAVLIVDGSACLTPEPVVFTVETGVPTGPALVGYQIEIGAEPGRIVEVPVVIPIESPPSGARPAFHAIDVRMTSTAERRVVAAVRVVWNR